MCFASRQELKWTQNVAYGCNFTVNHDFKMAKTNQIDCRKKCFSTYGCSHFVWSSKEGGTCFLKKNAISKSEVIASNDPSSFCGIVEGKSDKKLTDK